MSISTSKILLIDDEEDFLFFIKLNLEKTGKYKVFTAKNGFEGINMAEKFLPDLILLDIMMPEIDGGEIAQRLKTCKQTQNIPIIFLTAILTPGEEDKLKTKHRFIAKPIALKKLENEIDLILSPLITNQ